MHLRRRHVYLSVITIPNFINTSQRVPDFIPPAYPITFLVARNLWPKSYDGGGNILGLKVDPKKAVNALTTNLTCNIV